MCFFFVVVVVIIVVVGFGFLGTKQSLCVWIFIFVFCYNIFLLCFVVHWFCSLSIQLSRSVKVNFGVFDWPSKIFLLHLMCAHNSFSLLYNSKLFQVISSFLYVSVWLFFVSVFFLSSSFFVTITFLCAHWKHLH